MVKIALGFTDLAGHPTSSELPWARDLVFSFSKWPHTQPCLRSVTSGQDSGGLGLPGMALFTPWNSQMVWLPHAGGLLRGEVLWHECLMQMHVQYAIQLERSWLAGSILRKWVTFLMPLAMFSKIKWGCSDKRKASGAQSLLSLEVKEGYSKVVLVSKDICDSEVNRRIALALFWRRSLCFSCFWRSGIIIRSKACLNTVIPVRLW